MIPTATWKEPKKEKTRHMKKYKLQENMTKERWGEEARDKYLTTWTSQGGETRRHIDYISINAKYRNTARKAHRNIYRRANMNQNQKHRVQTTQLYNASKKYKPPTPQDTGRVLKYDLRELRPRPEKLNKWYQEQEQEKEQWKEQEDNETKNKPNKTNKQEHANNAMEEWLNYKAKIGKALIHV